MSIRGLVAQLAAAVAFQLARYRRCRAIQSCRDFLVRLPSGMPLGNRTPLVQRELLVMIPHRNTSYTGCCTSFVNPSLVGAPILGIHKAVVRLVAVDRAL